MSFKTDTFSRLKNLLAWDKKNFPENSSYSIAPNVGPYILYYNDVPIAAFNKPVDEYYDDPSIIFAKDIYCFPNDEYEKYWTQSEETINERIKALQTDFYNSIFTKGKTIEEMRCYFENLLEKGETDYGRVRMTNIDNNPDHKAFFTNVKQGNKSRVVIIAGAEKIHGNWEVCMSKSYLDVRTIRNVYSRKEVFLSDIPSNDKIKEEVFGKLAERKKEMHSLATQKDKNRYREILLTDFSNANNGKESFYFPWVNEKTEISTAEIKKIIDEAVASADWYDIKDANASALKIQEISKTVPTIDLNRKEFISKTDVQFIKDSFIQDLNNAANGKHSFFMSDTSFGKDGNNLTYIGTATNNKTIILGSINKDGSFTLSEDGEKMMGTIVENITIQAVEDLRNEDIKIIKNPIDNNHFDGIAYIPEYNKNTSNIDDAHSTNNTYDEGPDLS